MALKDINQTIKINAETKNAVRDILQVKAVLLKVSSTAKTGASLVNNSLNSMVGGFDKLKSTITSFTAMYVGFTQIRNAFGGIILDAESVRRLDAAIQSMGVSTQISLSSVLSFADGLLNLMGQSAAETANIMTRLVDAGVKTQ